MKPQLNRVLLFAAMWMLASCHRQNEEVRRLRQEIDSLQKQAHNGYKPGLGEFMLGIQLHHAKLWFAGQNQNWALANFETGEIKETLGDVKEFCQDRPEVKAIGMIDAPLDSINSSIRQKSVSFFKRSFTFLTNTCNNCHKATQHGFNVITIPGSVPVSNQDFKPVQ